MSKSFELSFDQKKADGHLSSWQEEMNQSVGKSSKELGIYNRQEVEEKIRILYKETSSLPELQFINELKELDKEIGVYIVGGSIRDVIVGKKAKDVDLVVNGISPTELVNKLNKYGKVVFDRNPEANLNSMNEEEKRMLIEESYGVIKFKPNNSEIGELIDIAFPRTDNYEESGKTGIRGIKRDTNSKANPNLSIVEDLKRRDLTINAMAVNLVNGDIVDPFNGIEDLIRGEVKSVGDPKERILNEDLSRGFRAIRFATVLNENLENETKNAVKEIFKPSENSAQEIYKNSPEILGEVLKYEKAVREDYNISTENLPKCLQVFWDKEQKKPRLAIAKEVMSKEILKALESNPKKFIELFDEVGGLQIVFPEITELKKVEQSKEHHKEGDVYKHTLKLLENLPKGASLEVVLAGLFHDVGKKETFKKDEKGKITFYGHAQKSVEVFDKIADRLSLTNQTKNDSAWLINNHMSVFEAEKMKPTKFLNIFCNRLGESLLELSKSDALASVDEFGKTNTEFIDKIIERVNKMKKDSGDIKDIKPFITGSDLIKVGLKSGPQFKVILEDIMNKQLSGEIKNKEEALVLLNSFLN